MFSVAAEQELYRSCEIIFGLEPSINRDFLEYLRPSGLKVAFRKRALETHPDTVAHHGQEARNKNTRMFLAVKDAYENLETYLKAREKGYRFPDRPTIVVRQRPPASQSQPQGRPSYTTNPYNRSFHSGGTDTDAAWNGRFGGTTGGTGTSHGGAGSRKTTDTHGSNARPFQTQADTDTFYAGPLPKRKLLFGHFLYYSGLISWRTIVQALVWQRTQRPRVGEIARLFGWLTDADILYILQKRSILHPFGESAISLGLLTPDQLETIIGRQKRLQKKIGAYFVEHRIFNGTQLDELIRRCRLHNVQISVLPRQGCPS